MGRERRVRMLKLCAPMMLSALASAPDSFCTVNAKMKFSSSLLPMDTGTFSALENAAKRVVLFGLSLTCDCTIESEKILAVSSDASAATDASCSSATYFAARAVLEYALVSNPCF